MIGRPLDSEHLPDRLSVLITTYPEAFLVPGGGEVELVDLGRHLQKFNIVSDVYGSSSRPLHRYDAVLHFSVHREGLSIVERAKQARKPLILWPNVWWADRPGSEEINLTNEFFGHADRIVFKSRAEYENVKRYTTVDEKKVVLVPWGIDPAFVERPEKAIFSSLYGVVDYVLCLGIIEERKNQLNTIRALRDFAKPVVFIGDHRDEAYFSQCAKEATGNFVFLPFMPPASAILVSAVRECRIFLETSREPAGLSALEAAVVGKPLVLSDDAWARETFGADAIYIDPFSIESIQQGVEAGLNARPSSNLAGKVKRTHLLPENLEALAKALSDLVGNRQ